jgi:tripartite-type tricarboxylate transporter receptor subunit TctC
MSHDLPRLALHDPIEPSIDTAALHATSMRAPVDGPRRRLLAAGAGSLVSPGLLPGLLAGLLPGVARASQDRFPHKPITLIVPWPAGGGTDLTMRLLAEIAGRLLGQKVLTENRGGAGGTLGMSALVTSAPDGYTIAQMPQPVFRAPWTQKVPWDPVRDTTPIIQLTGVTFGIVTAPTSGLRTLDDVFTAARNRPHGLNVSTNGVGTTPHLVVQQLMSDKGLTYVHVPYKGVAEQMLGVSTGQVDIGIGATGFAPHVESGRLRLLAICSAQRSRKWPDVPTLKELGFPIVAMSPYGLAGPKGVPDDVVKVLHDAFKVALFDAQHVAELDKYDQVPDYLGPADYGRVMREQLAAERLVVEKLGLARSTGT